MPAAAVSWERFLPGSFEPPIPCGSNHTGRSVLLTGAGGYIGSALAETIAREAPSCLVLMDSSEHNLFEVQQHLDSTWSNVPHPAVLGSVDDVRLLDCVFRRFQPEIVYHAAAFKHVPLLEHNAIAAVRNNVLGTYALAQTAARHGTAQFVLISTDKAVNPHSVLGVSKRVAELTAVALSSPACRMNAIRLANVIGSPGSVLPIFWNQIARGESVTVTHPEATRWFLSRGETVKAVLACQAVACDGRILVPELGEPVRISDVATFLILSLAGKPADEVPVRYTGLRPGEKLAEEMMYRTEIREGFDGSLEAIKTCLLSPEDLRDLMERLSGCIKKGDGPEMIRILSSAVPEYEPSPTALGTGR